MIHFLVKLLTVISNAMSSSVRRIFERGGGGGGARKFRKFENNEDQNEDSPAQNQVRFPAQN